MSSGGARIMAVGAHPADPFERAGGTLAKHLARGDEAIVVSLTSGAVTHAFTSFPATGADKLDRLAEVKAAKAEEFRQAAEALGATRHVLYDLPESPMVFGPAEYVLMVDLIREVRPDAVLCAHPAEVGRHDHMDSGRFTIAAVDYARAEGFPSALAPFTVPDLFLFYYEDFRSEQLMGSARHSPEVVVDITETLPRKREAMRIFGGTQARQGEDYPARLDRFFASVDGAAGYVNGFGYAERFTRWHPERVQHLPLVARHG